MPTFGGVAGTVYYKAWRVPAPRKCAVVFLHGFGEHSGLYHRLGNALNNAGIELWALDEIGHGLTEGDRAVIRSVDDLGENGRRLTALAEAGQPGGPVWLAGHSLGSAAAALAAAREPGRYAGLILSGAALSPLDWVLALGDDDAAELALDLADLSSDPFYLDELTYDPLAFTSAAGARTLATVLPQAWDELAGAFGQVTLPVLFVHGSEDQIVPVAHARAWSSQLAGARLAEFAGARHDILNETVHREVAAAITEFVLHAAPGSAADRPIAASGRTSPTDLYSCRFARNRLCRKDRRDSYQDIGRTVRAHRDGNGVGFSAVDCLAGSNYAPWSALQEQHRQSVRSSHRYRHRTAGPADQTGISRRGQGDSGERAGRHPRVPRLPRSRRACGH